MLSLSASMNGAGCMTDPILSSLKKRLEQDEKTVMAMAAIYCRGHHHCAKGDSLCAECAEVISTHLKERDAARTNIAEPATPASQCYRPSMRQKIKE